MSYIVPAISSCLFLIGSIIHIYARHADKERLSWITKPMLMPLLLVTFLTMVVATHRTIPRIWLIVAALLLYTGGDILLLFPDKPKATLFVIGMGSFMAGHICYMAWFLTFAGWNSLAWPVMGIVAVLTLGTLIPFCKKILSSDKPEAPYLCAYGVLMGCYCVCIASTWSRGSFLGTLVALAGAAVFSLSDSIIAMDKIDNHIAGDDVIMTTYILANVLLLAGVWLLTQAPTAVYMVL